MQKEKIGIREIDNILNRESGLKGISALSNDMRILTEKEKRGHKGAGLAIEVFVYRIRKYISAYVGIMAGADAVIFTAGIGEHQDGITEKCCRGLFAHLKKQPRIFVIPTNEELMIARQTFRLIKNAS